MFRISNHEQDVVETINAAQIEMDGDIVHFYGGDNDEQLIKVYRLPYGYSVDMLKQVPDTE